MEPIRILIVDDHNLFRAGLAGLLNGTPDMEVVGEASGGAEAVEKARELMPDVILMDLRMPRCDGVQATRLIRKEMPGANIVMLTMSEKDEDLFEAMRAGAKGYILKTVTPEELMSVLACGARGHVVVSPSMAEKLLNEFGSLAEKSGDAEASIASLTKREKEILILVAQGLNNREIAKQLFLSEGTVKTHLRNVMDKLHLHSRMQTVAFATQEGLLPDRSE